MIIILILKCFYLLLHVLALVIDLYLEGEMLFQFDKSPSY